MATTAPATTQQYSAANNANDRAILLSTGIPMTKRVGLFGPFQPGSENAIKLLNVGVTTGLDMRVTASVDNTGTVAAVASPLAPYNLLSEVNTKDYNTKRRVFAPGHLIAALNSIRGGRVWMGDGQGAVDTNQTNTPTAVGTGTLEFSLYIPIAYNASADLRGALDTQMSTGDVYVTAVIPQTMVGDESNVYVTTANAAPAVSDVYIEIWQHYIQPQVMGSNGLPILPLIDLATGYEFAATFKTSDNLAVGGSKFINYPDVRQVLSSFYLYMNGGALTVNGTDLTSIDLVVGAATKVKQLTPRYIREKMRLMMGGDLYPGLYYIGSRNNPVQVSSQSIVQTEIVPAVVNAGNTYISYGFESFYMTGQVLPGIAGA